MLRLRARSLNSAGRSEPRVAVPVLLALILVATACSGSSAAPETDAATIAKSSADTLAATTVVPRVTTTLASTTASTVAAPSDDELVAAARAAFDSSPQPVDLVAWDHLDASVVAGIVRVEVCGWTGDTVFGESQTVDYLVAPDGAGSLRAAVEATSPGVRGCSNRELVESIFEATRAYDSYWGGVLDDPGTFDPAAASEFKSAGLIESNVETVAAWTAAGLSWKGHSLDGALPDSAVVDSLWRSYVDDNDLETFELLVCRELDPDHGLYRGDVMVDDFKEQVDGSQVIDRYRFRRQSGRWLVAGLVTNAWANCTGFGDGWLDAINEWQPEPAAWQVVR